MSYSNHLRPGHQAPYLFVLFGSLVATFMSASSACAQLSGTYTIGSAGDYASFNAAITALETEGITGPVIFRVQPGTYNEQIEINTVPGSACDAPITFEGDATAQSAVVLQAPDIESTSSAIQINNVDGLSFRNMSILSQNRSSVIDIAPGSDCFVLENNVLNYSVRARATHSMRSHDHQYRNNTFLSGGIYKENAANWNPNAPIFDDGLVIEGNKVGNITINGQQDFIITNNQLYNAEISITNSWYGQAISKNSIKIDIEEYNGVAIDIHTSAASTISENQIQLTDGGTAMQLSTGKSVGAEVLVANNLVSVSGYDARGIYYDPLLALVGLNISSGYNNMLKIYHNTVWVFGYSETFSVPNYTFALAGENNSFSIKNNVFGNSSNGTNLIITDPSAIAEMDYNNLYDAYAKLFARWGSQEINSLAEWQSITGFDAHSINVNPGSSATPNETLQGAGIYVSEVPQDIFGNERPAPPTIGAVELEAEDGNQAPTADAGPDRTVTLPQASIILRGKGSDPDGNFRAFLWEKVSGPSATLRQQNTANLKLSDLVAGVYVFRFSATDNDGATASDEVTLTVVGGEPTNQPPVADAGQDKTLRLPNNSIILRGKGNDPDGNFRAFFWEKVSGPSATLNQQNTANLKLSNLVAGEYVFRFSATDNDGATASDETTLRVIGTPEAAPLANTTRVTAYPNTFRDDVNVTIETSQPASYQMEVYDALGRSYYQEQVAAEPLAATVQHIDLSNQGMRAGVYFISVNNANYRKVIRVVKAY